MTEPKETEQLGVLQRSADIRISQRAEGVDGTDGDITEMEVVFSTDAPYRRWFGWEVLGHKRTECNLRRLRNDAPFLADHNNSIDSILGKVVSAKVQGGEGIATIAMADTDRAREFARMVDDGFAGKLSVGYEVEKMEEQKQRGDDDAPMYRATRWTPLEVSAVAVPADDGARVTATREQGPETYFRKLTKEAPMSEVTEPQPQEAETAPASQQEVAAQMDALVQARKQEELLPSAPTAQPQFRQPEPVAQPAPAPVALAPAAPAVPTEEQMNALRSQERQRVVADHQELMAYAKDFEYMGGPEIANEVIRDGGDMEELKARLLQKQQDMYHAKPDPTPKQAEVMRSDLGFERHKFSVKRALDALVALSSPGGLEQSRYIHKTCGYEMEVLRGYNDHLQTHKIRPVRSQFSVPSSLLVDPDGAAMRAERAESTTTLLAGGDFVPEDHLSNLMIQELLADAVFGSQVTTLSGLMGDVDVPKIVTGIKARWVDEATDSSAEQALVSATVNLSPKQLQATAPYSRKLQIQSSPQIEGILVSNMRRNLALAIDDAIVEGQGSSNQPQGVLYAMGGATGTGGNANRNPTAANNGVLTGTTVTGDAPTWGKVMETWGKVHTANAAVGTRVAWAANAAVAAALCSIPKAAQYPEFILDAGTRMIGMEPFLLANQIEAYQSKGGSPVNTADVQRLFFGYWDQVLLGLWSGIDLLVDPYTKAGQRLVIVHINQDADIAVAHKESFGVLGNIKIS